MLVRDGAGVLLRVLGAVAYSKGLPAGSPFFRLAALAQAATVCAVLAAPLASA